MRQKSPSYRLRAGLPVDRADRGKHRFGRRQIPFALEISAPAEVKIKIQLDLDFGIVGGKSHATAHDRYLRSRAPIPMRPVTAPPSLPRIERLAAEALLEFIGVGCFGEAIHMKPLAVVHSVAASEDVEAKADAAATSAVVAKNNPTRMRNPAGSPCSKPNRRHPLAHLATGSFQTLTPWRKPAASLTWLRDVAANVFDTPQPERTDGPMKLNIYLNYGGNCAAALRFYEQHLGGKIMSMMTHGQQPDAGAVRRNTRTRSSTPAWPSEIRRSSRATFRRSVTSPCGAPTCRSASMDHRGGGTHLRAARRRR